MKKFFLIFPIAIILFVFAVFPIGATVDFSNDVKVFPPLPDMTGKYYICMYSASGDLNLIYCNDTSFLTLTKKPDTQTYFLSRDKQITASGYVTNMRYNFDTKAWNTVTTWTFEWSVDILNTMISSTDFTRQYISNSYIICYSSNGDVDYLTHAGLPARKQSFYMSQKDIDTLGVECVMPRNGFVQSQINTIASYWYWKIPYDNETDVDSLRFSVTGYIDEPNEEPVLAYPQLSNFEYEIGNGFVYGTLKAEGHVLFDIDVTLIFSVRDCYGKVWTVDTTVKCLTGFVDDDTDGFDDRTTWGDDYFERPSGLGGVNNGEIMDAFGSIRPFFESLWGIIPMPILVIIISGTIILIAIGVLKAVL